MRRSSDRVDLGCCPTCRRHFRDAFDHPRIRVRRFERLPVLEAFDRHSTKAMAQRSTHRSNENSDIRLNDDGINITQEIADVCDSEIVQQYFGALKALEGKTIDPGNLNPPWKPDRYFKKSYPIPETRFFLGVFEGDDSTSEHRVAEIGIMCEGMNLGRAGGATLQILGPIARIHYEGLLIDPPQEKRS